MAGIFSNLFRIFNHKNPHEELRHLYSQLESLGTGLSTELKLLRDRQKELVRMRGPSNTDRATGKLGLSKTAALERQLVPKLKSLAEHAERRFLKTLQETNSAPAVSEEERFELRKVIEFLEDVQNSLQGFDDSTGTDELVIIETRLRTVSDLCEEFHDAEKAAMAMRQKSRSRGLTGIAKRVYDSAHLQEFTTSSGGKNSLLVAELSQNELNRLYGEAREINTRGDSSCCVNFRSGWVDGLHPEIDATTGLRAPHVNVTMKDKGTKKKIHIVIKS